MKFSRITIHWACVRLVCLVMPFIFLTFLERARGINRLSVLYVEKLRPREAQRLTAVGKEPVKATKLGQCEERHAGRVDFSRLQGVIQLLGTGDTTGGEQGGQRNWSLCKINLSDPPLNRHPKFQAEYSCPGATRRGTNDPTSEAFPNSSVAVILPI